MVKNFYFGFVMIIFSVFLATESIALETNEKKLMSSAKKVVAAWGRMLSKGYMDVSYDTGKLGWWRVTKHLWVDGSAYFDIRKTDSIVSPYKLIITFKTKHCGDNDFSPNANGPYSDYFKRKCGFKTVHDALSNINESDFLEREYNGSYVSAKGRIRDMMVIYAFQNSSWVIKDGNKNFNIYFGRDLQSKENGHYFKDLIVFPVE